MTVNTSVNVYINHLLELGTALDRLRQMMDVDELNSPHLVDHIHAETLAVIGCQVACLDAAQKAGAARSNDLSNTYRFLSTSNQSFLEMFTRFYASLYTANHIIELERLIRKKESDWANIAQGDMQSCQLAMQNACASLLACWQSLAETLMTRTPTFHTTSIGQQFSYSEHKE